MKAEADRIISEISPRLTMHDFRVVEGPTHSNLIFDLVIPHDFPMTEVDVVNRVKEQIRALQGCYYAVIQVDHSFA